MIVKTATRNSTAFTELVRSRTSVRKFKPQAVPEETLKEILELGRRAPSEWNLQPWRFILVREEVNRRALAAACPGQSWVGDAPVVLIACGDTRAWQQADIRLKEMIAAGKSEASKESEHLELIRSSYSSPAAARLMALTNTFVAVQQIALVALALGVGSCWIGGFDEERIKQDFQIPPECLVAALLPMGYPDEASEPTPKLKFGEVCFVERYGSVISL